MDNKIVRVFELGSCIDAMCSKGFSDMKFNVSKIELHLTAST